jgi:tetratricopeptide (TPR) repeat protein
MQQKHYDLAKVDYESFLLIEPQHFEARLGLAHVLQKLGRRSDAIDEYNRMVQLFPDSAEAYASRAAYETELKQYDVALYDWDEAIRRHPKNGGYYVSKADVYLRQYKNREAKDVLDAAVKQGVPRAALREWYKRCK